MDGATDTRTNNFIRREIRRLHRENETHFKEVRKKHQNKVRRIKERLQTVKEQSAKEVTKKEFRTMDAKRKWMEARMRTSDYTEEEAKIPIYGDLQPPLDEDEEAVLVLPKGFITYPNILNEDIRYEAALTNSKVRYNRMGAGKNLFL